MSKEALRKKREKVFKKEDGTYSDKKESIKKKSDDDIDESTLDKYCSFRPSKEKADEYKKKIEQSSNSGKEFFKIPMGETIVRFLPSKDPTVDNAYVQSSRHYIESEGESGTNYLNIKCKGLIGGCLACRAIKFLNDGLGDDESKKLAKRLSAQPRYLFSIYLKDTKEVKILSASQTLASRIISGISRGNPFHPLKGQDFVISKKEKNKFPNYDDSGYIAEQTPLIKAKKTKSMSEEQKKKADEEAKREIIGILNAIPDLSKFIEDDSPDTIEKFKLELFSIVDESDLKRWEKRFTDKKNMDKEEKESSDVSSDYFDEDSDGESDEEEYEEDSEDEEYDEDEEGIEDDEEEIPIEE